MIACKTNDSLPRSSGDRSSPKVEVVEVIHNFFQMNFVYKKFGFSSTTSTP